MNIHLRKFSGIIQKLKFGRRNLYSKAEVDNLIISGKLAKYSRRK